MLSDEEYKELYGKKYYWDVLVKAYTTERNSKKEMDPDLVVDMATLLWKADKACERAERTIQEMKIPYVGT